VAIRIASLFVGLTADDRDYNKKLRSSRAATKQWETAVNTATTNAANSFRKVTLGVTAAGVALTAVYASSAREIDELAKNAAKLGDSSEDLFEFGLAAQFSGVEVRSANVALQRMTRRLSEAAQGSGEAKGAIAELGLDAKELANLRPTEAFEAIQEALEGVVDQNDKVRLAFKFFDSEGVALVNTTRDVLQQARDDVEALGGAITDIEAAQIEIANDSITRLGVAADLVGRRITVNLAGSVTAVADQLFESAKQSQQLEETIDSLIASAIGGLSSMALNLSRVLGFIEGREEILEFGVLGFALFGRKGALLGALIGSVSGTALANFNSVRSLLGLVDGEQEQLQIRLQSLQQELRNIEENSGFLGDTLGGFVNGIFFDEAEDVKAEIAVVEAQLAELGDTSSSTTGFVGALSDGMGQLAEALSIAGASYGQVFDVDGFVSVPPPPLDAPLAPDTSGILSTPSGVNPVANQADYDLDLSIYTTYQNSRVEAARLAAEEIAALAPDTRFDVIKAAEDEALEASREAFNRDIELTKAYYDQKESLVRSFQTTWTGFQKEGAANRFSILYGETTGALSQLAEFNRGFFKLNQAAGLANAVVNVAQGITEALKLPFPASLAAGVAVAAKGAAQIAAISQARFGQTSAPSISSDTTSVSDVSSPGTTSTNIESGSDTSNEPNVQNTYFIVSADELIDPQVFADRSVEAVANASNDRRLVFNTNRNRLERNTEEAFA